MAARVAGESPGAMSDLVLRPARGLPDGLIVPDAELVERFSRSSGPGGQSVNTTDSRVELRWDVAASGALGDEQRARLLDRLGTRLVDGVMTVTASEHRSQLQNRAAARARLAALITDALAPPPPARRATRPSRAARERRLQAKRARSETKARRTRPDWE
ncbi:MAG TPA: alternative ribosome rescue aminoacyl-tRNA hydrolase ArfB [Jatrophihabitantaceae bacterium]|nr:alternative ribosome rescue aminoacyl-tRNA hydrolase ArfB [Jatrophihabitantaceae bacterium]